MSVRQYFTSNVDKTSSNKKRKINTEYTDDECPSTHKAESADSNAIFDVKPQSEQISGKRKHVEPEFKTNLRKLKSLKLDLDYGILFSRSQADSLFKMLEEEVEYDASTEVKIYGKVYTVNRKVTSYGDAGLTYTYANTTSNAKPWPHSIQTIKDKLLKVTGKEYNFVLVNRYSDGSQCMGEHRDNEKELDHSHPIASVSFGQHRDFIFRHRDNRGKTKNGPANVKLLLEHGSLLVMNPPTNDYWYHSLPKRSVNAAPSARINLTFRKILVKK